ncbi:DUF4350 domain-containing protein [Trichlorobacter lovleyi]|uniref:DUF4350 domain-containing protein n=1 Tax=Trichlorobacter lovleyi TaxID=313985 RepID=UPI00223F9243|nr:DUF4350 domain-containing protein [Trichlorobacter lovleyi]QOX80536.1 DUF4350 domain-containing protein [Trichlorobacter lovleyi]
MSARSKLLILTFCLLLVLAAASLYQLFALRFEAGDLFPAGSSLRSDPLGSMAFYQALERTGGVKVERNYRPLSRQKVTASTILLLGNDHHELATADKKEIGELEQLVTAGSRVVVAFNPVTTAPACSSAPALQPADSKNTKKPDTAWGVSTGYLPVSEAVPDKQAVKANLVEPGEGLPTEIRLLSRLTLQPPPTGWRTIYGLDGKAVVLERRIGSGSLVLVSDSSLFSNEALQADRQAALLVWLLGDQHRVIFDEFHLGVREQGGIMALARRFGLLPLIGVLLLLAGLYIWQQSIPLISAAVPLSDDPAVGVSHDSFSGLVNLLQRNIPANQLLKVCCQEWQKSFKRELQQDAALRKELSDAMTAQDDPVARYQRIARLRAERTGR